LVVEGGQELGHEQPEEGSRAEVGTRLERRHDHPGQSFTRSNPAARRREGPGKLYYITSARAGHGRNEAGRLFRAASERCPPPEQHPPPTVPETFSQGHPGV